MSVLPVGFGSAAGGGGFQIERSLRFNSADTAYLNRTPASAPSNADIGTWSFWVKRTKLATEEYIFGSRDGSNVTLTGIRFTSGDAFEFTMFSGGSALARRITTQLFRDPSAWYHFVIVYNSPSATASERVRIYVNGVEITAFSTTTNPSQNQDLIRWAANGIPNYIGNEGTTLGNYGDYYLTETYYIDGQALTPSSFGETDTNTGVWKPKAYTGTYGTNGFYLPFKTASQWSGYFDGTGDYLSFNGSTGTTLSGDFTVESWVYLPSVTTTAPIMCIGDSFSSPGILFYVNSSSKIAIARANTVAFTGSTSLVANTWNHVAFVRSGSTITGYLNGVSQGTFTNSSTFSGTTTVIGREVYNSGVGGQLTGYISNLRIVNGTAVYTGTFTPPTSQLTAITNTSLLTCQSSTFVDNSTNAFTITAFGDARPQQFSPFTLDVTDDHSGTGNNWIPNNLDLRTTGTGADILVDSPTSYGTDTGVGGEVRGNYCTLNSVSPLASGTLSNGNLSLTTGVADAIAVGTMAVSSGKWYWEITATTVNASLSAIGIIGQPPASLTVDLRTTSNGYCYISNGNKGNNNTTSAYGATYTSSDVIGVALDLDAGTLVFYKNGVSQGTAYSSLSGTFSPAIGDLAGANSGAVFNCNFGQRAFAYTAPSGFKALCTQNLPPVTIGATSTTQANDYFNVLTYTGTGTQQSLTGVGFQPDFIWFKSRSAAVNHALIDAVRGRSKILFSSLTDAEATSTTTAKDLVSFDADGFTVGVPEQNGSINNSGASLVAWNWKANGAGSSNTAGSITSTVSANTTSGFSIVTYTGTGANATVGHGCQVGGVATAPSMIIIKGRSTSVSWPVWHSSFGTAGNSDYLLLNTTDQKGYAGGSPNAQNLWNSTTPTASVFSLGTYAYTNANTTTYVAYCFAPVAGYSAFGSYTGNGAADGPFVYLGFRPAYVLIKRSSAVEAWCIMDSKREGYNVDNDPLFANLANAEGTQDFLDLLSNGFKLRSTDTGVNGSGTYIYAAFAESPFKYSLAR